MIDVTFLGTGYSVPTKQRNHSAVFLAYGGQTGVHVLFDCGEGTQRQFRYAGINPCKVDIICLTHKHMDHTLGLPGLLTTLEMSGYQKTLKILGPRGIKRFLQGFFDAVRLRVSFPLEIKEVTGTFLEEKDFFLEAAPMDHGTPCNGYSFVVKGKRRIDTKKMTSLGLSSGPHLQKLLEGKTISHEGKKYTPAQVTYSEPARKVSVVLDTRKNKEMAVLAKGAQVFVCEASYIDDDRAIAKDHMHMTAKEAAQVAKQAKVGKLYLTHVSGRYDLRRTDVLEEAKSVFAESYLAKDLERISVR